MRIVTPTTTDARLQSLETALLRLLGVIQEHSTDEKVRRVAGHIKAEHFKQDVAQKR